MISITKPWRRSDGAFTASPAFGADRFREMLIAMESAVVRCGKAEIEGTTSLSIILRTIADSINGIEDSRSY
ncbi:hypothetical protein GX408_09315 [bacterium]|nr:hypothetical protein [bacterium]